MGFSVLTPEQRSEQRAASGLVLCEAPYAIWVHGAVGETHRCSNRARFILTYQTTEAEALRTPPEVRSYACGIHRKSLERRVLPEGWAFVQFDA